MPRITPGDTVIFITRKIENGWEVPDQKIDAKVEEILDVGAILLSTGKLIFHHTSYLNIWFQAETLEEIFESKSTRIDQPSFNGVPFELLV